MCVRFAFVVDENIVKAVADAFVANGMKDAGYTYINIDDCEYSDNLNRTWLANYHSPIAVLITFPPVLWFQ